MKKVLSVCLFFAMAMIVILPVPAQANGESNDKVEINHEIHHDTSAPLRNMTASPSTVRNVGDPPQLAYTMPANQIDTVIQRTAGTLVATTSGLNFAGVGSGDYGFAVNSAPPDTNGAVGDTQYVQWVNSSLAVFNKTTGALVYGPVAGNTIWSGFGGGCQTNNDGDPIVQFDKAAHRWVLTQFSVTTTPYLQCVAVSTSADATGTYNRYAFSYGTSQFPDYPKLGVWPDGYYISYNIFTGGTTFAGAKVCAFDRAMMLTGAAATQQCFQLSTAYGGLLPSDLDGSTQPSAGEPNMFLAFGANSASLDTWKFHVDFTTPANSTFTGPTNIAVPSFVAACSGGGTCIPQSGTSQQLDSLADRVMYRLAYRNFGDHEALLVNQSVTAGSSVGIRWYELRNINATPTLYQTGTYAPDATYRWMGSIAMDKAGDIALGYSASSSSINPSIRYTGRVPTDALGTLQAETTIKAGSGSQTGNLTRWGDYSAMTVDPTDDCTFFYTNEYLKSSGSFNWSTQIASFKFPSCNNAPPVFTSVTVSPASASVVINGTQQFSATGLDQYGQPLSPQPTFAWTVSGGGTISTSGLFTAGATTGGPYTVTATSGSLSGTASVTVTAPITNDFSISASPNALSIVQGSAGTSTISTAVTSGSAAAVSLSASVSPTGPSVSVSPTTLNAGSSATLTVSVGASVVVGTYTVTIIGTEGSATHNATVTVSVTAPSSNVIKNGDFETGSLTNWTTTGTTGVVNSGAHGGTYAARLGSSSPTSGNSSIVQTFTAPAGAPKLSFWYNVTCPDTVTYDWATATLRDNTSSTTRTVLAKTCVSNSGWKQVTATLTAGHSYTLTLTNRDDNYPGDPTFTLYDDVVAK